MESRWIVGTVALLATAAMGQMAGVKGNWRPPTGSIISAYSCGDAVCMKIMQLEQGAPGTEDHNNPEASLRSRPLCGLQIGSGFKVVADGNKAEGGTLYDPKAGKTYSGALKADGDVLKLRGYIGIKMFGRSEEWTRVHEAVDVCRKQ